MRMWLVDPKIMCRQHLLGEHLETHMFASSIKDDKSMSGFIREGCLEPKSLFDRHDELAEELSRRNYKHKTPLEKFVLKGKILQHIDVLIDREKSLDELLRRCPTCYKNYIDGGIHEKG